MMETRGKNLNQFNDLESSSTQTCAYQRPNDNDQQKSSNIKNDAKKIKIKGRKVKQHIKKLDELDESDEEFLGSNNNDKKCNATFRTKPDTYVSDKSPCHQQQEDKSFVELKFHNKLLNTGKMLSHWNDNSTQKVVVDLKLLEKTNNIINRITSAGFDSNLLSEKNKQEPKPLERWSSNITGVDDDEATFKTNPLIEEKLSQIQKIEINSETKQSMFEKNWENKKNLRPNTENTKASNKSKEIIDKTLVKEDPVPVINFPKINSWFSNLSSVTKIAAEATRTVASNTMIHAAKQLANAQNILLQNTASPVNSNLANVNQLIFEEQTKIQQTESNVKLIESNDCDDKPNVFQKTNANSASNNSNINESAQIESTTNDGWNNNWEDEENSDMFNKNLQNKFVEINSEQKFSIENDGWYGFGDGNDKKMIENNLNKAKEPEPEILLGNETFATEKNKSDIDYSMHYDKQINSLNINTENQMVQDEEIVPVTLESDLIDIPMVEDTIIEKESQLNVHTKNMDDFNFCWNDDWRDEEMNENSLNPIEMNQETLLRVETAIYQSKKNVNEMEFELDDKKSNVEATMPLDESETSDIPMNTAIINDKLERFPELPIEVSISMQNGSKMETELKKQKILLKNLDFDNLDSSDSSTDWEYYEQKTPKQLYIVEEEQDEHNSENNEQNLTTANLTSVIPLVTEESNSSNNEQTKKDSLSNQDTVTILQIEDDSNDLMNQQQQESNDPLPKPILYFCSHDIPSTDETPIDQLPDFEVFPFSECNVEENKNNFMNQQEHFNESMMGDSPPKPIIAICPTLPDKNQDDPFSNDITQSPKIEESIAKIKFEETPGTFDLNNGWNDSIMVSPSCIPRPLDNNFQQQTPIDLFPPHLSSMEIEPIPIAVENNTSNDYDETIFPKMEIGDEQQQNIDQVYLSEQQNFRIIDDSIESDSTMERSNSIPWIADKGAESLIYEPNNDLIFPTKIEPIKTESSVIVNELNDLNLNQSLREGWEDEEIIQPVEENKSKLNFQIEDDNFNSGWNEWEDNISSNGIQDNQSNDLLSELDPKPTASNQLESSNDWQNKPVANSVTESNVEQITDNTFSLTCSMMPKHLEDFNTSWDDWGDESENPPETSQHLSDIKIIKNDRETVKIETTQLKVEPNYVSQFSMHENESTSAEPILNAPSESEKLDSHKVLEVETINNWDDKCKDKEKKSNIQIESTKNFVKANKVDSAILISESSNKFEYSPLKHKIVKKSEPKFEVSWNDWEEDFIKTNVESTVKGSKIDEKPFKREEILDNNDSISINNDKVNKVEEKLKIKTFQQKQTTKPKFNLVDRFEDDKKSNKLTSKPKFALVIDGWNDDDEDWNNPIPNSSKTIQTTKKQSLTTRVSLRPDPETNIDNYKSHTYQNSVASVMSNPASISSQQYRELHYHQNQMQSNNKTYMPSSKNSWLDDVKTATKTAAITTMTHAVNNWSFNPISILDSVVDNLSHVVGVPSTEEMATIMRQRQQQSKKNFR